MADGHLSFIHARDPSIHPYDQRMHRLRNVRRNIYSLMEESAVPLDTIDDKDLKTEEIDDRMQVYLRVKGSKNKSNDYIIQDKTLLCKMPEQKCKTKEEGSLKEFSFSKIFGPESTQIDLFNNIVKIRLLDFMNGEKTALFTYGASGGGKTFTIVGTAEEPGLIPRVLEYLFRSLEKLPKIYSVKPQADYHIIKLQPSEQENEKRIKNEILKSLRDADHSQHIKTYRGMETRLSNDGAAQLEELEQVSVGIWVSFAEIYNEEIFDLLLPKGTNTDAPKLSIGLRDENYYIKNLSHINVSNGLEAYQIFQYGLQGLKYAKTNVNSHSSRSHSIFSIKIVQASDLRDKVFVSSFSFCDLAGAERSKKTLNTGARLVESNNINKSLLVLDRCVTAIRDSQKRSGHRLIPFRESKLTQLFQRALLGFENLCMIVNISNSREMLHENMNVLNFSALTKKVIQSRLISESSQVDYKKKEIIKLENELKEVMNKYEHFQRQQLINIESERERLIEGCADIMADLERNYREKKMELQESMRKRYKNKLLELKQRSEQEVPMKKRKKNVHEKLELSRETADRLELENLSLQDKIKRLKEEKEKLLKIQGQLNDQITMSQNSDESFIENERFFADQSMMKE